MYMHVYMHSHTRTKRARFASQIWLFSYFECKDSSLAKVPYN